MSGIAEVKIAGCDYWADNVDHLVGLLSTSAAETLSAPEESATDVVVTVTDPAEWAREPAELRDALLYAVVAGSEPQRLEPSTGLAPVEDRLVFTVEEAAKLLGISRAFAYEAVKRGDIPSMRIGRRILVPKAALERFLRNSPPTDVG